MVNQKRHRKRIVAQAHGSTARTEGNQGQSAAMTPGVPLNTRSYTMPRANPTTIVESDGRAWPPRRRTRGRNRAWRRKWRWKAPDELQCEARQAGEEQKHRTAHRLLPRRCRRRPRRGGGRIAVRPICRLLGNGHDHRDLRADRRRTRARRRSCGQTFPRTRTAETVPSSMPRK